jgi:hypothetical protein
LLSNPGDPIEAVALRDAARRYGDGGGFRSISEAEAIEAFGGIHGKDSKLEMIDKKTERALRKKLEEIAREKAEAEKEDDTDRLKKLDIDARKYTQYLNSSSYHGKMKDLSAPVKKANDSVRKAMDSLRNRIGQRMPKFAKYLQTYVIPKRGAWTYYPPSTSYFETQAPKPAVGDTLPIRD